MSSGRGFVASEVPTHHDEGQRTPKPTEAPGSTQHDMSGREMRPPIDAALDEIKWDSPHRSRRIWATKAPEDVARLGRQKRARTRRRGERSVICAPLDGFPWDQGTSPITTDHDASPIAAESEMTPLRHASTAPDAVAAVSVSGDTSAICCVRSIT